jgi:glycosyltransferase involved in cell wall biosynthesis
MAARVAIIGTVGVPARYGGFESLAEAMVDRVPTDEFALFVYCARGSYAEGERSSGFRGHRRVFIPLPANGALSPLYDLVSILDAILVRRCRVLLCLGASGGVGILIARLLGRRVIFNVDGLESRRGRWSGFGRKVLAALEWMGIRGADIVVTDNRVIRTLVYRRYRRSSAVIAYGGDQAAPGTLVASTTPVPLPQSYFLSISRVVPENNVHLVLEAFAACGQPLVYVGNWDRSQYGSELRSRYRDSVNMHLLDPIYDKPVLDALRLRAVACIHGHSVGGTNPALVEALYWAKDILAFDCAFNRATLEGQFHYWKTAAELAQLVGRIADLEPPAAEAVQRLREKYRWSAIIAAYCALFRSQSAAR